MVVHRFLKNCSAFPQTDPHNPHKKQHSALSPKPDPAMSCKGNHTHKHHPCSTSGSQTKNDLFPDRKQICVFFAKRPPKTAVDAGSISDQCSHPDSRSYKRNQDPVSPEKKQPARYQTSHRQHLFLFRFYSQAQPPQIPQKQDSQFHKHPPCFFFSQCIPHRAMKHEFVCSSSYENSCYQPEYNKYQGFVSSFTPHF